MVLIKKKGEIWKMCIDYITLNSLIVEDKYSIPSIDLLDRLEKTEDYNIFKKRFKMSVLTNYDTFIIYRYNNI